MMKKITYAIKHIGVNSETGEEAQATANALCQIFCQERGAESPVSIFAGSLFEVMKHSRRGTCGHIALQTADVELAMADLAEKGIAFQEDTIRRDGEGRITFVYLQQEFGGFAVHLTV